MNASGQNHSISASNRGLFGLMLVGIGIIVLADQYLKTNWLSLMALPLAGIVLLVRGVRRQTMLMITGGSILTGLGLGFFVNYSPLVMPSLPNRFGLALLAFSLGWMLIVPLSVLSGCRPGWWALIPGSITAALGASFLFSPLRWYDFVFYLVTGLGLALLIWGIAGRLFGLIIAGSLLVGIGPGIYFGWGMPDEPNALARTGVMLVGFALGWGFITLITRFTLGKFVWWPFIPGGVLAMVGWGLYIGGNPDNALSFIGNTGSVGLILFGLYLMLLRKGIHK